MHAPDRSPNATIEAVSDFVPFPDAAIHRSLPRRVAGQVRAHGDALAIRSDRAPYTYASLDRASNRLAQAILVRATTACGVALPMPTLFHAPTVALMAEVIAAARAS